MSQSETLFEEDLTKVVPLYGTFDKFQIFFHASSTRDFTSIIKYFALNKISGIHIAVYTFQGEMVMKASMEKVSFGFMALIFLMAQVSPAAECYFASVRNAKLVDGGTVLEVLADFPCLNDVSPTLKGDYLPTQNAPFWVRDNDDKIAIGIEIDKASCQLGPRSSKVYKYNIRDAKINLPAYAYSYSGELFKPLQRKDYEAIAAKAKLEPCTDAPTKIYGGGIR